MPRLSTIRSAAFAESLSLSNTYTYIPTIRESNKQSQVNHQPEQTLCSWESAIGILSRWNRIRNCVPCDKCYLSCFRSFLLWIRDPLGDASSVDPLGCAKKFSCGHIHLLCVKRITKKIVKVHQHLQDHVIWVQRRRLYIWITVITAANADAVGGMHCGKWSSHIFK